LLAAGLIGKIAMGFNIETQEFNVAVSFSGEHREYVKAVVDALVDKCEIESDKIFYDNHLKVH